MANRIIDTIRGYDLLLAGAPDQGRFGMAPYVGFNGSTNYANRPAGVLKGINGFTAGGWFQVSSASVLMGVWLTPNDRVWLLYMDLLVPTFYVSSDGSALSVIAHPTSLATSTWYFLAVRYTPSAEIAIWVNGTKTVNTSSIPAALYDSPTTEFVIGGTHAGASALLTGKASMCWMCSEPLDDAYLTMLFETSRHLFSV